MSKILIVGPAYPLRGGLATYNERLAREFKAMGHQCDILSFSLQYPSLLFPGKTQFSTDAPPDDLNILTEINSINPFNWISVGRKIRMAKYDIVIFRYWMSFMAPALGTIARFVRANKHTRILAITDNIIPHERKFFDTPFTRYFSSACDGFLTMSHSVLGQLKQLNQYKPARYVAHPMYDMFGVEKSKPEARKILGLDADQKYLLFFGFIRKYKGLHLLLEAFADERVKQLGCKLIVAGEFYEDAQPYIDQIKALGLTDTVILSNDFIPNSEVSNYFCAADVVIQTYLNATQSGVTQIAYYYNKPMIVTNVGGLAELVPDNKVGYIVNVDKTDVANAIIRFYNDQQESFFIENLKIEKQKFTWTYLCNELLHLTND
ncbi:MAG: glycosyltransferase family 4 protein [Bacteroidota bacterium]